MSAGYRDKEGKGLTLAVKQCQNSGLGLVIRCHFRDSDGGKNALMALLELFG